MKLNLPVTVKILSYHIFMSSKSHKCFEDGFSPLKKIVLFASMKALKNDEKCFLFHLKVACRVKANMI